VARTADEVGGFAGRLRGREPGELFADIEDFARDHPALVFGAGFAVAFGVTRFFKSSSEEDGIGAEELPQATASPATSTESMSPSASSVTSAATPGK